MHDPPAATAPTPPPYGQFAIAVPHITAASSIIIEQAFANRVDAATTAETLAYFRSGAHPSDPPHVNELGFSAGIRRMLHRVLIEGRSGIELQRAHGSLLASVRELGQYG